MARRVPAGLIDYRLVRRNTVDEFRRGRLGRRDICDAHPELMRAARGIGRPGQPLECPICEESALVLSYLRLRRQPSRPRAASSTPTRR